MARSSLVAAALGALTASHASWASPVDGDKCRSAEASLEANAGATDPKDDPAGLGVSFKHPGTPTLFLLCQDSLFGVALGSGTAEPPDAWYGVVGAAAEAAIGVDAGSVERTARGCAIRAKSSPEGGATMRVGRALLICHSAGQDLSVSVTRAASGRRRR